MARILITAINYWPEPTGTAPYTTGLAEHLATQGHELHVLTGVPHYPSWSVDPDYVGRRSLHERRSHVTLLRRRHFVPDRQTVMQRARYELSFLIRGAASTTGVPDITIGVVPSLNGGVLARLKSGGRPYGVIVQDLMAEGARQSSISGGGGRVARAIAGVERWAFGKATAVGIVSEGFGPYVRGLGIRDDRILLTPNWTLARPPRMSDERRRAIRQRLGWGENTQVVLHAGNMGLKQGLDQVLAAARLGAALGEPVLFVLLGDGNQRPRLEEAAGGTPTIAFLPTQPSDAYGEVLAAADVLLVSEVSSATNMSLPSKLTSYLASGRPVLAAVRSDGLTAAELHRSGGGIVVPSNQPAAIIETLRMLRASPRFGAELAAAGKRYARERYGKAAALKQLDRFVGMLLEASAGRTAPSSDTHP